MRRTAVPKANPAARSAEGSPIPTLDAPLQADACYLAMKTRDARFDGSFFTGVTSTGIYCRPVCKVRLPRRENCRFFSHAAQAEHAGFRPCLRCRPELAPHTLHWSIQDASSILAQQAARMLDEPETWGTEPPTVEQLAARLGVSDRHLRRIFEAQLGVSPIQYLQTRRLLTAKQLLADTDLPITQIALLSGYASVRRFNAAFSEHYGLNPTQLRREGGREGLGTQVRLGYRPPYDVQAMLGFFRTRAITGLETVDDTRFARTLAIESGAEVLRGWLQADFDEPRSQVLLRVSESLRPALPTLIRRLRAAFDLDADPQAINARLNTSFPHGDALRVPGSLSGYELWTTRDSRARWPNGWWSASANRSRRRRRRCTAFSHNPPCWRPPTATRSASWASCASVRPPSSRSHGPWPRAGSPCTAAPT